MTAFPAGVLFAANYLSSKETLMPDFTAHLRPTVASTKPPPPLPNEIYPGVIKSYEFREHPNTHNPMVRFIIGLTGWPPSISEAAKTVTFEDGTEIEIDPTKRQLSSDFYLTEAAYYRLLNFLESLGITIPVGKTDDGQSFLDLETAIPKVVGCKVGADLEQYVSQRGAIGNSIKQLIPVR